MVFVLFRNPSNACFFVRILVGVLFFELKILNFFVGCVGKLKEKSTFVFPDVVEKVIEIL